MAVAEGVCKQISTFSVQQLPIAAFEKQHIELEERIRRTSITLMNARKNGQTSEKTIIEQMKLEQLTKDKIEILDALHTQNQAKKALDEINNNLLAAFPADRFQGQHEISIQFVDGGFCRPVFKDKGLRAKIMKNLEHILPVYGIHMHNFNGQVLIGMSGKKLTGFFRTISK